MKTCHLYARVSTNDQDTAAQLLALHKAAKAYPDHIQRVWQDIGSGSIPWRERGLAAILATATDGDMLLVPEISRIGRSTADVLDFIAHATKQGLGIRIDKSNLTIGDNMQSKIISTVMALAAEIERDFLRSRTREGMQAARQAGKQIGRPKGPAAHHSLDGKHFEIEALLKKEIPKASICKLIDVSPRQLNTHLNRVKKGLTK